MALDGDWLLTPERAAVHLPTATAVVADLHLGYTLARQSNGEAVPASPVADALAPLRRVLARRKVERLVVAGDLFENARCESLAGEVLAWLAAAGIELAAVVPGNHDRGLDGGSVRLPVCPDGVSVGDWQVVHGDRPLPGGRIVQGHIHPCLRWSKRLVAPCYLEVANHLILPAFSADAAGVNVLRDARWQPYHCHVIAGDEVLDFGEVAALRRRSQGGKGKGRKA